MFDSLYPTIFTLLTIINQLLTVLGLNYCYEFLLIYYLYCIVHEIYYHAPVNFDHTW